LTFITETLKNTASLSQAPVMNKPTNIDLSGNARTAEAEAAATDRRRNDTLNRLRAALLEDRLAVLQLSGENTGTDPYNSGIMRGPSHLWRTRSR
jgi:hypothetical protein